MRFIRTINIAIKIKDELLKKVKYRKIVLRDAMPPDQKWTDRHLQAFVTDTTSGHIDGPIALVLDSFLLS